MEATKITAVCGANAAAAGNEARALSSTTITRNAPSCQAPVATWAALQEHLHRGGAWAYWWVASEAKGEDGDPERLSFWWPTGKPLPLPPDAGKYGPRHIYFSVHPSSENRGPHRRSLTKTIEAVNCLFGEFDAKDYGDKARALARVDDLEPSPSVVVDSGGGYHAYWLLRDPYPLTTESKRQRARDVQARWVEHVGGDPGAKDLARVLRVPGTLNYKEAYAPNFPTVAVVRADFSMLYDLDSLEALLPAKEAPQVHQPQHGNGNGRDRWAETAFRDEIATLARATVGHRNSQLNDSAFALGQIVAAGRLDRAQVEQALTACAHGLGLDSSFTERDVERTIRSGVEAGMKQPRGPKENGTHQAQRPKPAQRKPGEPEAKETGWLPERDVWDCLRRKELGDAEMLAKLYAGRVVYDHAEKRWYLWRGHCWKADRCGFVKNLVSQQVASQYLNLAAGKRRQEENGLAEALTTRAGNLRHRNRINNVLSLAKSLPELATGGGEWDADPWLLGVGNGVIDLRTGELRPGIAGDYIRTVAPTDWHGLDAPAPRWERFLQEIFNSDGELISFTNRLFGYGMTGLRTEHVLPTLWGSGRNGKDTLLAAVEDTLGKLAGPASQEVLLGGRRNPNAATPHVYAMRSLRLTWVSETNEGARLDAGQVKLLTGGGTIKARPLYGDEVEFRPQYLLLLVTNFKPHANAEDYALWKRILLIPFTQAFVDDPQADNEHQRDPYLADKLKAEAPGILAWLVRGCLEWQRYGLQPPESVRLATEAYQQEEDTVGQFLEECCVVSDGAEVRAGDLYDAYRIWAKDYGVKAMFMTTFGKRMKRRFTSQRKRTGIVYFGVGLLAQEGGGV